MAKYYGAVGYEVGELVDDVWTEYTVERNYCGDSIRTSRRLQGAEQLNDNIVMGNQLSIVSDPFARQHFSEIRYATYMGIKWKVTTVEVQYPRLILTLGEVYNDAGPAGNTTQNGVGAD